jgi:formate-nitrite transporter family protein
MADMEPEADTAEPTHSVEDLKAADAKELHQAVREEGEGELKRPTQSLFWSGVAAGFGACASLATEGALYAHLADTPARLPIAQLGYPVGFLIAILGRMQLFTESTVTAMIPLVHRPSFSRAWQTLRLWGVVLLANLIGSAAVSACVALGGIGEPATRAAMIELSMAITHRDALETFFNAVPAGFLIASVAWMLPNAREHAFFVIAALTYVITLGGFAHSIIGSAEAFVLLFAGRIDLATCFGGFLGPAVIGNLVGGAGLFALLAHAQVAGEVQD